MQVFTIVCREIKGGKVNRYRKKSFETLAQENRVAGIFRIVSICWSSVPQKPRLRQSCPCLGLSRKPSLDLMKDILKRYVAEEKMKEMARGGSQNGY